MQSAGISNVVSAFIDEQLRTSGFTDQGTIDLAGAGFQVRALPAHLTASMAVHGLR